MLAPGTIFAGRYCVERAIGKGGMGIVYEVVHLETDKLRALKVMHDGAFASDELRQRFRREARVTAKIDSEFIVEVFDAGLDEATSMPFLVMELLRGEEIGQRIKRLGPLPLDEAALYLSQAAMALDRTHAASIVHRDLKPANLFLTARDDGTPRIKILDFGVAKLIADGETQGGTTTLGTPLYMAPEQCRFSGKITAAADIYALGLIAYTLLAGRPYWEEERKAADNVIAFAMKVIHGPTEPACARARRRGIVLPAAFDAWFARATACAPEARFPSAGEAAAALAGALGIAIEPPRRSLVPALSAGAGDPIEISLAEVSVGELSTPTATPERLGSGEVTMTEAAVTQKLSPRRRRSLALSLAAVAGLVGAGALGAFAVMRLQSVGAERNRTGAAPLSTGAEPLSHVADPQRTTAEPLSTGAEPPSTAAEPLSTGAEPLRTAAEPLSTSAERNSTHAERNSATARPKNTITKPSGTAAKPKNTPASSPPPPPSNLYGRD